jgi:flagellar M-ring protein FliF
MPDNFKKLYEPFLALPPSKRWLVGGIVALSIAAFSVLIFVANKTDFRPLFANLTTEDAGEIVKKLKDQKVPYQLSADGKAVLVPSDKVYELRLTLASEGLPQGGGVGYEIFDRKNFGMTEFVQKLNYQRALQGELSRTISQLAGVEQARVHLAIPEKSLFKDAEKLPTASIVLKIKGNRTLRDTDVQGIVHLVAASVEGLDTEHVTVLDGKGKILSRSGTLDATSKMTGAMQETQRSFEKSTEDRLQSLLDKVVGTGKSVARVSATFNFKQVEKFEERYDPEAAAVRSEQRSEEKNSSGSLAGVPGVQTNLGRNQNAPQAGGGGGSKSDETLNYEVSRSTARTIEPVGSLAKVSVAILVDGKYDTPAAGKDGKVGKPKYAPRTPDELTKIEALVKSAVGFSPDRGDQVTVANIPFQETDDAGVGAKDEWWNAPIFLSLLKSGLIGVGFLALLFMVIRPLLKSLKASMPQTIFEPEERPEEEVRKMIEVQREQLKIQAGAQLDLIERVKTDSYQASQIIKNWMDKKEGA